MSGKDKILVTGASGQLGRRLVKRLCEASYPVRAHYRSHEKAIQFCPADAEPVIGDLLQPSWLINAVSGCSYVIHCAAKVSLRPMPIEPIRSINVGGTSAVIDACLKAEVKRLIHVSSTAAVGGSKSEVPLDETAIFNLSGYGIPYFETKRESEMLVLDADSANLETVVVNPSIMIAPPDSLSGSGKRKRIPRFLPLYFDFGINVVDTRDVVEGILLALEKGRPGQRYILSGENLDHDRFFELAEKYINLKRPLLRVPRWVLYTAGAFWELLTFYKKRKPPLNRAIAKLTAYRFYYDCGKAKNELGWNPRSLEQSVEDILRASELRGHA